MFQYVSSTFSVRFQYVFGFFFLKGVEPHLNLLRAKNSVRFQYVLRNNVNTEHQIYKNDFGDDFGDRQTT